MIFMGLNDIHTNFGLVLLNDFILTWAWYCSRRTCPWKSGSGVAANSSITSWMIRKNVKMKHVLWTLYLDLCTMNSLWAPRSQLASVGLHWQWQQWRRFSQALRGALPGSRPPYMSFIGWIVYWTVLCYHIPSLFPCFLLICYSYISLHY